MTTIRQRLTWRLLAAVSALVLAGGASVFALVRHSAMEQFDDALAAKARAVAGVTRQRVDGISVDSSGRFMREFEAPDEPGERPHDRDEIEGSAFFELYRADGGSVARSESLARSDLEFRGLTTSSDEPAAWNVRLPRGTAGRAVGFRFVPRLAEDALRPPSREPLVLIVATSRHELDETLTTLALVLLGSGGVLLGAVVLLVPRVLRREMRPLDRLADQAVSINAQSLAARFSTDGLPAELGPIAARLNDLLARLEDAFEHERQFSADLAHELRTPIAELRSQAELAIKWPDAKTADADQETLAIARQLEGIVSRLLALLRSERGQVAIEWQPVDPATAAEQAWRPLADRALERRLQASFDVASDSSFRADPILLRSILTNVFENAVDYAPAGGRVTVSGARDPSAYVLQITNDATELGAADLSKFFDRFWRRDPARAGSEHSGLGLSLARAFARAHGWDLTAAFANGRVTLTLAATSPS